VVRFIYYCVVLTERNSELIHNARRVYLKSQEPGVVTWQKIYATPSSIRWSTRPRKDASGVRYETTLSLDFPGMGIEQFSELEKLVNSRYALQIESDLRDLYELAGNETPAEADYSFNNFGTSITFTATTLDSPRYLFNLEALGAILNPQIYPITLATTL